MLRRIMCKSGALVAAATVLLAVGTALCCWQWVTHPLRHASTAYEQGQWDFALNSALVYLQQHPGSTPARLLVARCSYRLGRWEDVERHYSAISNRDALPLEDRQWRAVALTRLNRTKEACELYQQLCDQKPDDPHLLQQWAALLITQNETSRSIELCERLAEFPAHRRSAYFLLATAYMQKAEYAAAVEYFERILQEDPDLLDPITQRQVFWEDLGSALLKLGRWDRAQKHLERALVLHRNAEILDLLAQVHEAQGNDAKAEQYWLEALAENANFVPALRSLARLAMMRSEPEKSIEHLSRALEIDPGDVSIYVNLAVAYERAGQTSRAAGYAQRAEQLRHLKDLQDQLASYVQSKPNSPEARLLAAIRDIEQQRLVQAEERLRKLLNENPDFAPAQRLFQLLNSQHEVTE